MFTGLVEAQGKLLQREEEAGGVRLHISHSFSGLALGDSISVSGACLTVVAFDELHFETQASQETLQLTTLGSLSVSDPVNLERALAVGDRLGGHFVSGHVDGRGRIQSIRPVQEMTELQLEIPQGLRKYVARKGSLTVDGVSLTINRVEDNIVALLIVPHTAQVTTFGALSVGDEVNLEVDLIARYLERLVAPL